MKTQRDQLLDILASGMAFKCSIILDFDVRQERLDSATVPLDVHKEAQRMMGTLREDMAKKNDEIIALGAKLLAKADAPQEILTKLKKAESSKEYWHDKYLARAKEKPAVIPKPAADKPTAKIPPAKPKKKTGKRWLTDDEVWAIRRLLHRKDMTSTDVAKKFNIGPHVVWGIKDGRTYKNVPTEPHPSVTNVHAGHGVEKQA